MTDRRIYYHYRCEVCNGKMDTIQDKLAGYHWFCVLHDQDGNVIEE